MAKSALPTGRRSRLRLGAVVAIWQELLRTLADRYRPELHYMRGPGPKWRAKHQG